MALLRFRQISLEDWQSLAVKDPDTRYIVYNEDESIYGEFIGEEKVTAEVDAHIEDLNNPHEVTAEQVDTYNKATIDNKDAITLQEAKDHTYSKVEIDDKDTAIMNMANDLENANMFKDVSYNNVNGVLTFTRYDGTTKEIDLPLELIVTSGYYDEVANELVLVLANSSEIRIPVDNLLTDLDAHNIRFNGSGTNYLVSKPDVESAVKELDTQVKEANDGIALKVSTSDIVDNLNSTDTDKPLSANQGKVLNDTTAKLAVSNVFTQPQQVPNAALPQHATNKLQVETMFEMFKRELSGYNLAMPDLTGKEYLGDGRYRVYGSTNRYYDYNVYNGNNIIKTTLTGSGRIYTFNVPTGTYTITVESNNRDQTFYLSYNSTSFYRNQLDGGVKRVYTYNNVSSISVSLYESGDFTTEFKLQIEKGTEATPYTVPGEIPQYALKQQEAWITPTMLNGWVNTGVNDATLQYFKDSTGTVHIKGVIKDGTSSQIFSLPEGYRPNKIIGNMVYGIPNNSNIIIRNSGLVTTGSNAVAIYINISFSTNTNGVT